MQLWQMGLLCCYCIWSNGTLITGEAIESKNKVWIDSDYDHCILTTKDGWICPSLSAAYNKLSPSFFSDCTIFFLHKINYLNRIFNFTDVQGLTFSSEWGDIVFKCDGEAGMTFANAKDISFRGDKTGNGSFKFESCGQKNVIENGNRNLTSTLLFQDSENVFLKNVLMSESIGYGVYFSNCSGMLSFDNVTIQHNELFKPPYNDTQYGGAIVLDNNELSYPVTLDINLCHFENVSAFDPSHLYRGSRPDTSGFGAGIAVMLSSNDNTVHVSATKFVDNKALNGGGMYILLGPGSKRNNITILSTEFTGNTARQSGGGLDIFTHNYAHLNNNDILLDDCTFLNNRADNYGGGFSQRKPRGFHQTFTVNQDPEFFFKTKLIGCKFIGNSGNLGFAIYLDDIYIMFDSKTFNKPTEIQSNTGFSFGDESSDFSTFFAYSSDILVLGKLKCLKNLRTAITLDYSSLHINGSMELSENNGYKGGAMSLYEDSQIVLYELGNISFTKNTASRGGAMYVQYETKPIRIFHTDGYLSYRCFYTIHSTNIKSTNQQQIHFIDNTASQDQGKAVFVSSLDWCNIDNVIPDFNLEENDGKEAFNTDPRTFQIDGKEWENIYPGRILEPHIYLTDELGNNVSTVVEIKTNTDSVTIDRQYEQFLVVSNKIRLLSFIGKSETVNTSFTVSITVVGGRAQKRVIEATIQDCAFGYVLTGESKKCECSENSKISRCKDGDVYIRKDFWVYKNRTDSILQCPPFYCNCTKTDESSNDCLYEAHRQCVEGKAQNSILCSKCNANTSSIGFGGNSCMDCSSGLHSFGFLWILPTAFIVIFILAMLFIKLEIDIYRDYLNSTIFFYQIVPMFAHGVNTTLWSVSSSLIGVISLRGFNIEKSTGFCFLKHLTQLDKAFTNYFFPMMAFLCIFIIYKLGQRFQRFHFQTNSYVRAAVFIIVWVYGDMVRVTFVLFKYTEISNKKYLYVDASESYKSPKYIIFAIVAGVVAVLTLLIPLSLMFSSFIVPRQPKLKLFFDNYKLCFKEDTVSQFFAASFFGFRLVLFAMDTFMLTGQAGTRKTILAGCVTTFYVVFTFVKPYDNNYMYLNYYDSVVLAILVIVSALSCALDGLVHTDQFINAYNVLLNLLLVVPIIWAALNFIRRLYRWGRATPCPRWNEEGIYICIYFFIYLCNN